MANITVTVPDDVYRLARIRAAEEGTSVSALVAEYLRSLSVQDVEYARLARLQTEVLAEIGAFSAGVRLRRDEVHSRAVR